MRLYLVERTDDIGYDETESLVVLAKDEDDAIEVASEEYWGDWLFNSSSIKITRIHLSGKFRSIHLSFNAG